MSQHWIIPSSVARRIAGKVLPSFPRSEVYQPLELTVQRVAAGDRHESHPLDAAILAELRRLK